MKIKKNILILIGVIVVLGGLFLALTYAPGDTVAPTEESEEEKNLIDVMKIDTTIASYAYSDAESGYEINYAEGRWFVDGNKNAVLSESSVYSMLSVISDLKTETIVEENSTDLAKYGIDDSKIIKVTDDSGNDYAVKIGSQTATESGYYAVVDGETKIFILSADDYALLCGGLDSIRHREFVAIRGDILRVTIINPENKIVIHPKESVNVNASNLNSWEMVSPFHKDVNDYIFEENVINAFDFTAVDFVDDNPSDYSVYGLSNPSYTIIIETNADVYKVYLGNVVEGNKIYAKTDDAPNVYTISTETVKYRDFTPIYLLDSLIFSRNIFVVDNIVFKGEEEHVLKIDGSDYIIDGKKVDEEKFRRTYLSIISSVISGEVESGKIGKEICSLTVNYNNGTPSETVVFYEYGDMYCAVSVNGVMEFYVKCRRSF